MKARAPGWANTNTGIRSYSVTVDTSILIPFLVIYSPNRSFWGTHFIIFTLSGTLPSICPAYLQMTYRKVRVSYVNVERCDINTTKNWKLVNTGSLSNWWVRTYQICAFIWSSTFCGICLKASMKIVVVSSGISDTMLPRVNTINPCSPDTQGSRSCRHTKRGRDGSGDLLHWEHMTG